MRALSAISPRAVGGRVSDLLDPAFRGVVRNSSWSVAAAGLVYVALIVETIILARYLGPARFGVYLLIIAYPEAVQQLLDFRTQDAMTKYLGGFLAQGQKHEAVALVKFLWLVDAVVSSLAFGLVAATAGFAAGVLVHDDDLGRLMVIFALGTFFASLDTASGSILRVLDRFALSFATSTAALAVRLALIAAVVVADGGLAALIWARVAAGAVMTVVQGSAAVGVLKQTLWNERHARLSVLRGRFKEITRFLLNTNLTGTVKMASAKLDTVLVGLLATPTTVSIYRVAVQFGTAPLLISDPLFAAVYPTFSKWESLGRFDQIRALGRKLTGILAAVAAPVAAVVLFWSEDLVVATVGDPFTAAAVPLVILLVSVVPAVVFFWVRATILSLGQAGALLRMAVAAVALQVIGLWALVPTFGAIGGAVSVALMNLSVLGLQLLYLHRRRLLF